MTDFRAKAEEMIDKAAGELADEIYASNGMGYEYHREVCRRHLRAAATPPKGTIDRLRDDRWRIAKPDRLFEDGERLLCAVPLASGGYDMAVVTANVDEGHFALKVDGEVWGWEWSDVEWWKPCPTPDPSPTGEEE